MKTNFYKIISIVLSLVLIFTCCAVSLTVIADETTTDTAQGTQPTETQHIYYVASGSATPAGNDETGTGTAESPFLTVSNAITKMVADAETGGYNNPLNTVYLKVVDTVS